MHNLKRFNGSYKGLVGECMFKLTKDRVVLTKFFNRKKYLAIFGKYLSPAQIGFIDNNWFSIDAIEITFEKGIKKVMIYEIKTKNEYPKPVRFKPKMTLSTHKLFNFAKETGFIVNIATVHLHENWDFSISLSEFDAANYCIDKPKRYDRKRAIYEIIKIRQSPN